MLKSPWNFNSISVCFWKIFLAKLYLENHRSTLTLLFKPFVCKGEYHVSSDLLLIWRMPFIIEKDAFHDIFTFIFSWIFTSYMNHIKNCIMFLYKFYLFFQNYFKSISNIKLSKYSWNFNCSNFFLLIFIKNIKKKRTNLNITLC